LRHPESNLKFGYGIQALVDETHLDNKSYIDKFRIQVSLGSTISRVDILSDGGFKIHYKNGDYCDDQGIKRYSSSVEYICEVGGDLHLSEEDLSMERDEVPTDDSIKMPTFEAYEPDSCHYSFKWKTSLACSQCKKSQVEEIKGSCVAFNDMPNRAKKQAISYIRQKSTSLVDQVGVSDGAGFRQIAYVPKEG
jgi:hypothetical protein